MRLTHLIGPSLIACAVAGAGFADESHDPAPGDEAGTLTPQTHCPVMGGEIDSSYFTDIEGQRVYHCCDGCSERFSENPDTYFRKAAVQGILFENIQTKCPVNGKSIDETIYTDYQGRRIYFASKKCLKKFSTNPAKYLRKLEGQPHIHDDDQQHQNHDSHQGGHSGHGGGCGM